MYCMCVDPRRAARTRSTMQRTLLLRPLLAAALLACCALAAGADAPATTTTTKPKRKFCNATLPGDYRYEACGEFCKSAKAKNHCQYCKCHTCTFCTADIIAASKKKQQRFLKKKGPFAKPKKDMKKAASAAGVVDGALPGKKKGKKGKRGGMKRRVRQMP